MNDFGFVAALLVATIISLGAIFWVVLPLLQPGRGELIVEDDRVTQLLGRKDATLRAIKELEFDYHVGKIDEEDYQRMDQRLRRQAIGYMQQIEKLAPDTSALDDALEAEIAKRRKVQKPVAQHGAAQTGAASAGAAVNGHGEARPVKQQEVADGQPHFCTNCGAALEPTHKFCANCGTPVNAPSPAVEQNA